MKHKQLTRSFLSILFWSILGSVQSSTAILPASANPFPTRASKPLVIQEEAPIRKIVVEKVLKEIIILDKNTLMSIINAHGALRVEEWDKDEVDMEVIISAEGLDEKKLNKLVEQADVQITWGDKQFWVQTKLPKTNWNKWHGHQSGNKFTVDYKIFVPVGTRLKLSNTYGNVYLGDLTGPISLDLAYGMLKAGKLDGEENEIRLQYAPSSAIQYAKTVNLKLGYSNLNLEGAVNLVVKADYSQIKVGKAESIEFNLDYGSLDVGETDKIEGRSGYVPINIEEVKKEAFFRTSFGNIQIKRLAKQCQLVEIDARYAILEVGLPDAFVPSYELELDRCPLSGGKNLQNFQKPKDISSNYHTFQSGPKAQHHLKIKAIYGSLNLKKI